MPKLTDRLVHAWNAFMNKDPTINVGPSAYRRPDRVRLTRGNERSIVTAIFNRIAMDVAAIDIKHVRLDDDGRYIEDIKSNLNECLTLESNLDQTARAFKQDAVLSMFDDGLVAIVPVDTTENIFVTGSFDISTIRTGKVVEWFPAFVKVNVYNEKTGKRQDVLLPKRSVALIENPLYPITNEPNSVLQRLIRKLNLLDAIDEQSGSGKLDLIIQLPYVVKSDARRKQAEERRQAIEDQLSGSKYGIAYTDGTEKITQLNRAVENNLLNQIEYLTSMLYSQLGVTQEILNGTADEKAMLNYFNRTIEPIVSAMVDEMKRKFLTKKARTQNQSIVFFRDPFKLVPVGELAEIADKFTRNEIMTSNEIRQVAGMKPSSDPKADQLVNSNISQPNGAMEEAPVEVPEEAAQDGMSEEEYLNHMKVLDNLDAQLDALESKAGGK